MKLLVNIRPCEAIPRGYGFAYHGSYSDTTYVAPIPLNFVIGAWHNFYWFCLVRGLFNQSPLIGVQNFWRGKGFSEGEAYGYEKGIRHAAIACPTKARGLCDGSLAERVQRTDKGRPAARPDRPGRDGGRTDFGVCEGDTEGADR